MRAGSVFLLLLLSQAAGFQGPHPYLSKAYAERPSSAWRGQRTIATVSGTALENAAISKRYDAQGQALLGLLRKRGGAFMLPALDPNVVKAAFGAVTELLICCGIGATAARTKILDRTVVASLSKVVYHILLPALLVVNVARTVYSKSLVAVLPLPFFAIVQVLLCTVLARLMNGFLRLDPKSVSGREIGVCCTYGNSGVLPILFASVLLRNSPDPTAINQAISYISFYLLGWSPIFWAISYIHSFYLLVWSPIYWTAGYSQLAGPKATSAPASESPAPVGLKARLARFIKDPPTPIKRVMSPPIIGSLTGLVVGVSPLAKLFLAKGAPLSLLTNAVETLGKAYSPVALLVLAGSLGLPIESKVEGGEKELSPVVEVAAISFVRFLLCPLLFLSIITRLTSGGFVTLDKLMLFVLFLESAMPSAQNTVIIHSLEGRAEAGTRLARILLWIYMLSALPISILLSFFLQTVPLT